MSESFILNNQLSRLILLGAKGSFGLIFIGNFVAKAQFCVLNCQCNYNQYKYAEGKIIKGYNTCQHKQWSLPVDQAASA